MAISRSLGCRLFTSTSPIKMLPSSMASRPAIMLRVVDLPQPEGPRRVTNSPGSTRTFSRLTATTRPKRFVRFSKTSAGIC